MKKGARRMSKKNNMLNKKPQILKDLIIAGVLTEDDLKKLTPQDLLKNPAISFSDIKLISEMQKSVKNNKLLTYLSKDINVVDNDE